MVLAIAPLLYDQNLKPETATRQRTKAPLEGNTFMGNMQMLKFWAPVVFKILKLSRCVPHHSQFGIFKICWQRSSL